MKFVVGELVIFHGRTYRIPSGEFVTMQIDTGKKGNCVGMVIEVSDPPIDVRLFYSYHVRYQNGYCAWESEESLMSIENYLEISGSSNKS